MYDEVMSWLLEVKTPDRQVSVYTLVAGQAFDVGRDRGEIRVPADESVSSRHLRLHVKMREILFEDLGSTNGVFHRQLRKATGVILPGDELAMGQTTLRFTVKQ